MWQIKIRGSLEFTDTEAVISVSQQYSSHRSAPPGQTFGW